MSPSLSFVSIVNGCYNIDMAVKLSKEEKKVNKSTEDYEKALSKKGDIEEWTDAFLLKFRDKMRLIARDTRGFWTFDFYEGLQAINKESIKRDLPPATK